MRTALKAEILAAALVIGMGPSADAQQVQEIHPGTGGSPHVRAEWMVEGATISIQYGRPYMKGRQIMGHLVPYGVVWRTGADEATTLRTDRALVFGDVTVPAGEYTLYTVPGGERWELIINRQTGQWGTEYDRRQDLARIPMARETLAAPVEQLTIAIQPQPGGGVLSIEWEQTRVSVPFKVQGT